MQPFYVLFQIYRNYTGTFRTDRTGLSVILVRETARLGNVIICNIG